MGEPVIASPVPFANRLLIRGTGTLFCIGSEQTTAQFPLRQRR